MKDLIAKFRAFSRAHKVAFIAFSTLLAALGGDYALRVRPAAMMADHHPVNLPVKRDPNAPVKFGATGDNGEGIFIDATNHTLDLNSKKIAHLANGTLSTDGAAFGQIAATTLNTFATPIASVNMGSQKLISLADGTASSDGAAFHQIGDAVLAGRAVACDALTTANQGTLSGTAQTIDGVALSTVGMRACTFGQTTVTQDGCYVVASGAWTRCTDLPVGTNASNRFFVTVAGSANKGVWAVQVGANVVGTNDLVVANQASGGGGAVSSVFTRTGAVVAAAGDYTPDQVGALAGIDAAAVTTKALSAYTYANGTAGVGATITGNVNQACDTIDGLTPSLTPGAGSYLHVLVQNGAAFSDNGLYIVTQVGSGSLPCILTRDPRVDTPGEIRASEIHVTQGISRQSAVYKYCNDPNITIGTTALAWLRQDANRINEVSEFRSDFNTITLAPTTGQTTPSDGLFYTITGTGAAVAIAVPASHTENGALTYGTGTTTTGLVTASYAATNRPLILDTSQYIEFEVKVSGPDTLSDGTNTFRMLFGLADNIAVGSIANGIYIQYTQGTSTSWLGTNRATSADTTATGSTVSAGVTTYRRFLAKKFAGESAVHWYDSGSEMTGSPISGAPFGVNLTPVITITKSAGGTSRSFNIDFIRVLIGEINGRAA